MADFYENTNENFGATKEKTNPQIFQERQCAIKWQGNYEAWNWLVNKLIIPVTSSLHQG